MDIAIPLLSEVSKKTSFRLYPNMLTSSRVLLTVSEWDVPEVDQDEDARARQRLDSRMDVSKCQNRRIKAQREMESSQ